MYKESFSTASLFCVLALSSLVRAEGQQYTVTDLGTLPGQPASYPTAINASGQVIGYTSTLLTTPSRAFLWSDGAMTDLGTLFPYGTFAYGINASGQVVGGSSRAFLWNDGVMTDLGLPGGEQNLASGINDAGQIIGIAGSAPYDWARAFLLNDGRVRYLGYLPGHGDYQWTYAYAINNSGNVVGSSGRVQCPEKYGVCEVVSWRAFLWNDGVMTNLGTLPGHSDSFATGINDSHQVVGYSGPWDSSRGFVWSNGVMTDLGILPGGHIRSSASGINASGQVVGTSDTAGNYHAFLWSDGVMSDLNDFLPPDSGWELRSAAAINDRGQIVGRGVHDDQDTAYLLTPIK